MQFLAKTAFCLESLLVQPRNWGRQRGALTTLLATAGLVLAFGAATQCAAQNVAPQADTQTSSKPLPAATPDASVPETTPSILPAANQGEVTEEELRRQLVGKPLFLRGGYSGDSLSFTERGNAIGHPGQGSFTLSGVQIDRVRLSKHKVELEGARYAVHYIAGTIDADPSKDVERIKITPKKRVLKITIDREQVIKAKAEKTKPPKNRKGTLPKTGASTSPAPAAAATTEPGVSTVTPVGTASSGGDRTTEKAPDNPAEQAAEQPAEGPSHHAIDSKSETTTTSPAHASAMLRGALDRIFATGMDARLQEQMPMFWQLYFRAQKAGIEYRPHDPGVLRSNAVDQQAKVLNSIAPDSNEFAQANGISGRALYRTVIGADGTPTEIAVVRPIGFGLDEKAVEAIRKAKFEPAIKAGQPVAETLDLAVMFRTYSKRTGVTAKEAQSALAGNPVKPGPYSVQPQ